jgi:hypothetical protein
VDPSDPSVELVETADDREPSVADLIDSTSLGRGTRRGESA